MNDGPFSTPSEEITIEHIEHVLKATNYSASRRQAQPERTTIASRSESPGCDAREADAGDWGLAFAGTHDRSNVLLFVIGTVRNMDEVSAFASPPSIGRCTIVRVNANRVWAFLNTVNKRLHSLMRPGRTDFRFTGNLTHQCVRRNWLPSAAKMPRRTLTDKNVGCRDGKGVCTVGFATRQLFTAHAAAFRASP